MIKSADVVVVGGGVIGLSSAYYLSKERLDVAIIEKGELASQASGANQGGCPIAMFDTPILELALESRKLYTELNREMEFDIELVNSGLLICALDSIDQSMLEVHQEKLTKKGMKTELVSSKKLKGVLSSSCYGEIQAAIISDIDMIVNPFRLVFGFVKTIKNRGGKVYTNTRVEDIETANGKVYSVITDKGEVKCEYVVNAAGVGSPEIGKMVNLDIPVKPQRGQILVTEPVAAVSHRYMVEAEYLRSAFEEEDDISEPTERQKLGISASLAQEPSGNWTIGASRDFAGFNKDTELDTLALLAKRVIKFLPYLKKVNVIRAFAGLRPYCHWDGYPIMGGVDELEGYIIATGHAGEGVALSPITGKLISEAIIKGSTSVPIDHFNYSRFEG